MNRKIPGNWLLIFAVVAGFTLLAGAREFVSFVVDLQFFRETGFEAVFAKTFTAKMLARAVSARPLFSCSTSTSLLPESESSRSAG